MATTSYTDRLLELPTLIARQEHAVADKKMTVAVRSAALAVDELNVMLTATADAKDADTRKMQREAAVANNEHIAAMRGAVREDQTALAISTADRDRLIREYDALLALVKAG